MGKGMGSEPCKWDEVAHGAISLEAIRLLFQPAGHYRVSWNRYPPEAAFEGWSRAGRRYIISGRCVLKAGSDSWELSSGDYVDVSEGDYYFSVLGDSPVELVSVWELPEGFRRTEDGAQPAA